METFPVFTEEGMICGSCKINATLKQVEINGQTYAMTTLLMSQPGTFLRATMRVTKGQLEIVIERKVDEFTDADHELSLSLPQG